MKKHIISSLFILSLIISVNACSHSGIADSVSDNSKTSVSTEKTSCSTVSVSDTFYETVRQQTSDGTETLNSEKNSASVVDSAQLPDLSENSEISIPDIISEDSEGVNMNCIIEEAGFSKDDIYGSSQLIAVCSDGSVCSVRCFEQNSGKWTQVHETSGFVGINGVSADSCEGDYKTPAGLFSLGTAFGTENISINYPYRIINENCYWVDDTESDLYNQWVESETISWNSAEHLIEYPDSYKYAVAVNYNTDPVIPGSGSAIFLHCSNGTPTAGCVSVPENDMKFILDWLGMDSSPFILIE